MISNTTSIHLFLVPSEAAAGIKDYNYDLDNSVNGRCPSYAKNGGNLVPRDQFERVATDFEDTIDFKQNSGQWTSSNNSQSRSDKTESNSGSGSGNSGSLRESAGEGSRSGSGSGGSSFENSVEPN